MRPPFCFSSCIGSRRRGQPDGIQWRPHHNRRRHRTIRKHQVTVGRRGCTANRSTLLRQSWSALEMRDRRARATEIANWWQNLDLQDCSQELIRPVTGKLPSERRGCCETNGQEWMGLSHQPADQEPILKAKNWPEARDQDCGRAHLSLHWIGDSKTFTRKFLAKQRHQRSLRPHYSRRHLVVPLLRLGTAQSKATSIGREVYIP